MKTSWPRAALRAACTVAFLSAAAAFAGDGDAPQYRPAGMFNQHLYAGSFSRPRSVAFDRRHSEIIVGDAGTGRIGIFRPGGAELYSFITKEADRDIARVAVTPRGEIAVVAGSRSGISIYSYRGVYRKQLPLEGLGKDPVIGAFAWDADGNLYVGENRTAQVFIFDGAGKLRQQFGSRGFEDGQFEAISAITVDRQGNIWIADARALGVQQFDSQGNFLGGWGRHETGAENVSLPSGIAVTSTGHVLITDELRHVVKVFTSEGKFLAHIGGLGDGLGQLSFPSDIAIDSEDRIWVSERGTARVQIFARASQ